MKQVQVILILFVMYFSSLALSAKITSEWWHRHRHSRHHHTRSHHHRPAARRHVAKRPGQSFGKLGSFCLGAISGFSDEPERKIMQCIPSSFKGNGNAYETERGGSTVSSAKGPLGIVMKVGKWAIKLACKFKSKICNLLIRKRRRLFLEDMSVAGRHRRRRRSSRRRSSRRSSRRRSSRKRRSSCRSKWCKFANKIKGCFARVMRIFNHPFIKKALRVINCLKMLRGMAGRIRTRARNLYKRIKELRTGTSGVIRVVVGAICKYPLFIKSVKWLISGIKMRGNSKWLYIGKAVGKLAHAISESK